MCVVISFLGSDKRPPHKTNAIDVFAMAANNVLTGATSGQWNANGRERGNKKKSQEQNQRKKKYK